MVERKSFDDLLGPEFRQNPSDETLFYTSFINARNACSARGYHRVSRETTEEGDPMICYDCELWFDKSLVEEGIVKYIVEPLD